MEPPVGPYLRHGDYAADYTADYDASTTATTAKAEGAGGGGVDGAAVGVEAVVGQNDDSPAMGWPARVGVPDRLAVKVSQITARC